MKSWNVFTLLLIVKELKIIFNSKQQIQTSKYSVKKLLIRSSVWEPTTHFGWDSTEK
jgi:hypothetical protein